VTHGLVGSLGGLPAHEGHLETVGQPEKDVTSARRGMMRREAICMGLARGSDVFMAV